MKWSVVCDASTNDYGDELNQEVQALFAFEGSTKKYRVTFKSTDPDLPFEKFREKMFSCLSNVLKDYTGDEIAELFWSLNRSEHYEVKPGIRPAFHSDRPPKNRKRSRS